MLDLHIYILPRVERVSPQLRILEKVVFDKKNKVSNNPCRCLWLCPTLHLISPLTSIWCDIFHDSGQTFHSLGTSTSEYDEMTPCPTTRGVRTSTRKTWVHYILHIDRYWDMSAERTRHNAGYGGVHPFSRWDWATSSGRGAYTL